MMYDELSQHFAGSLQLEGEHDELLCSSLREHYKTEEVRCYSSRGPRERALWAIVIEMPTEPGEYARWTVVYVGKSGKRVEGTWHTASLEGGDPAVPGNDAPSGPSEQTIFDFDGDGHSEFVTAISRATDVSGNSYSSLTVWTTDGAKLTTFPATTGRQLIGITDQNHDGRPDFVEDPYQGATVGSSWGWFRSRAPWSSLLEVTPQGVVLDDGEASYDYARSLCPRGDGLVSSLSFQEPECVAALAHCASLWRVPTSEFAAALKQYCSNEDPIAGWCSSSLDTWLAMAATKHAVHLTEGESCP
jgi:hypothetical protein